MTEAEERARRRGYNAKYRARHPVTEKAKVQKAAWAKAHPEAREASRAKWRAANPERVKAYNVANRARRSAKIKTQAAASGKAHTEKAKPLESPLRTVPSKRICRSKQERRIPLLASKAKNRAKMRGMEFDGLQKLVESGPPSLCACCSSTLDYFSADLNKRPSLDRVDTRKGYTDQNTKVICYRCNSLKRDMTLVEAELIVAYMRRNLT